MGLHATGDLNTGHSNAPTALQWLMQHSCYNRCKQVRKRQQQYLACASMALQGLLPGAPPRSGPPPDSQPPPWPAAPAAAPACLSSFPSDTAIGTCSDIRNLPLQSCILFSLHRMKLICMHACIGLLGALATNLWRHGRCWRDGSLRVGLLPHILGRLRLCSGCTPWLLPGLRRPPLLEHSCPHDPTASALGLHILQPSSSCTHSAQHDAVIHL